MKMSQEISELAKYKGNSMQNLPESLNPFRKAEKSKAWLKIGLAGPSGSGKTYSALLIAEGLENKIAVIDTENHSASLYADKFHFDVLEIDPPYTLQKYENAVAMALKAGYETIIIDSISHQWAGEGGILDRKMRMDSAGGNSFTHWAKLTPEQERFKSLILQTKAHLICTMRSKQEYALAQDDKGRTKVEKLGMAPVQREGMEYEFTTMFDVNIAHYAQVSKDRTGVFEGAPFQITKQTGELFLRWLNTASGNLKKALHASPTIVRDREVGSETELENYVITIGKKYKGQRLKDVSPKELESFANWLRGEAEKNNEPLKNGAAQFYDKATLYLGSLKNGGPQFAPMNDGVPF